MLLRIVPMISLFARRQRGCIGTRFCNGAIAPNWYFRYGEFLSRILLCFRQLSLMHSPDMHRYLGSTVPLEPESSLLCSPDGLTGLRAVFYEHDPIPVAPSFH